MNSLGKKYTWPQKQEIFNMWFDSDSSDFSVRKSENAKMY